MLNVSLHGLRLIGNTLCHATDFVRLEVWGNDMSMPCKGYCCVQCAIMSCTHTHTHTHTHTVKPQENGISLQVSIVFTLHNLFGIVRMHPIVFC